MFTTEIKILTETSPSIAFPFRAALLKIEKRYFGYKIGTAVIKLDEFGKRLPKGTKVFAREIKHVFISYKLDENHDWMSFFTSHGLLKSKTGGEFIENIRCDPGLANLRYMNAPFIITNGEIKEYIRIEEGFNRVNSALKVQVTTNETRIKVYEEIIKNFKIGINPYWEETIVKFLDIRKIGNKLELTVKTRKNTWIIDERKIDIILKDGMEVEAINKNTKLFLNDNTSIREEILSILFQYDN